ncbi:hypothetical protein [Roseibium sp. M-1]
MSSFSNKLARAVLFGFASVLVTTGPAAARPNSNAMTCAQVQSMINQNGAVVLSTGQYTFDRYVSNTNFCQHGQITRWDYVPTKDARKCRVSRCIDPQPWRFD